MQMFAHRMGEPFTPLKSWDAPTKKRILQDVESGLRVMECVGKAQNLTEMKQCGEGEK